MTETEHDSKHEEKLARSIRLRESVELAAAEKKLLGQGSASPPTDRLHGDKNSSYELLELLGEGAMGKVYKASADGINSEFAIKIIHHELVKDAVALKRFEQEAKSASALTHPNLAAVYEYGTTADGAPFFVMDIARGISLAQILTNENHLEPLRALGIVIQAAEALQYAHSQGVLHRDVKPSNIIVVDSNSDGKSEQIKLIDFGIARVLEPQLIDGNKLTQTAQVLGSPAYMSPEQGMGLAVDARSDIYSLGCVLYEALSGKPPFLGLNPVQTIYKQVHEQPEALNPGSVCSNIATGLELVTSGMLEKLPEDRYQSMNEVRADLERIRQGRTPLGPKSGRKRFVKQIFASKTVGLLLGALLCLCYFIVNDLRTDVSQSTKTQSVIYSPRKRHGRASVSGPFPTVGDHQPNNLVYVPSGQIKIEDSKGKLLYASSSSDWSESLSGAIRKGTSLARASIQHAAVTNVTLSYANFNGASFRLCSFRNSNFDHCDFSGANFEECNFTNCQFQYCNMTEASFGASRFTDADFERCNMRGSHFDEVAASSIDTFRWFALQLKDCNLNGATFIASTLTNVNIFSDLTNVRAGWFFGKGVISCDDMSGADFSDSSFEESSINTKKADHANFEGAYLTKCKINGIPDEALLGANVRE